MISKASGLGVGCWVELGGSVRDSGSDTLAQADATEEGTVHHIYNAHASAFGPPLALSRS